MLNLIDFGLAKKYQENNDTCKKLGYFVGILVFANTAALKNYEQYPKEELKSVVY